MFVCNTKRNYPSSYQRLKVSLTTKRTLTLMYGKGEWNFLLATLPSLPRQGTFLKNSRTNETIFLKLRNIFGCILVNKIVARTCIIFYSTSLWFLYHTRKAKKWPEPIKHQKLLKLPACFFWINFLIFKWS